MSFKVEKADKSYLSIIFKEHQEEVDAPFTINCENNFYHIVGMQEGQKVEMIIPVRLDCYFEIRDTELDS
jgi:hypothetical protein